MPGKEKKRSLLTKMKGQVNFEVSFTMHEQYSCLNSFDWNVLHISHTHTSIPYVHVQTANFYN